MTVRQIAVAGSSGRMGRTLLEAVFQAPDMRLHAALDRHDSPFLGKDAGELVGSPCGVFITDLPDLDEAIRIAALVPAAEYGTLEIRPLISW